jgi:hypothetical protein
VAIPILRRYMSDEQIYKAMRLSLPTLLTIYAASQHKGAKQRARAELEQELTDAGALNVSVKHVLEETEKQNEPDSSASTGAGEQPVG